MYSIPDKLILPVPKVNSMNRPTIMIAGAGGIGQAVALLIAEQNSFEANIFLGDIDEEKAKKAILWIQSSVPSDIVMKSFSMKKEGISDSMRTALNSSDVLLDCLPGSLAPLMACENRFYPSNRFGSGIY